jgi:hypothetical protein
VDQRSGILRLARVADFITKATAVAPLPFAECPRWCQFLNEAAGGDAELIVYLQRWCGYMLTGDIREHALMFGHGSGEAGKSTFQNVAAGVLSDYAETEHGHVHCIPGEWLLWAGNETLAVAKSAQSEKKTAKRRGKFRVVAAPDATCRKLTLVVSPPTRDWVEVEDEGDPGPRPF